MRTRLIALSVFATSALLLASCGDDDPTGPGATGGEPFNTGQLPDTIPSVSSPYGNLAFGRSGNLLVASHNGSVYEYDRSSGVRSTIATGVGTGGPLCAVWDPATRLIYVGDTGGNIYSVDPSDGSSQQEDNPGIGAIQQILRAPSGYGGFGGMLIAATHNGGTGGLMAVDQRNSFSDSLITMTPMTDIEFATDGTLYAAQYTSGEIARVAPDGTVTVFADSLSNPEGIAIDSDGSRMWVAQVTNIGDNIIEITIPGEKKTIIAAPEFDFLYYPTGIAYDGFGNLVFLVGSGVQSVDFLDVK